MSLPEIVQCGGRLSADHHSANPHDTLLNAWVSADYGFENTEGVLLDHWQAGQWITIPQPWTNVALLKSHRVDREHRFRARVLTGGGQFRSQTFSLYLNDSTFWYPPGDVFGRIAVLGPGWPGETPGDGICDVFYRAEVRHYFPDPQWPTEYQIFPVVGPQTVAPLPEKMTCDAYNVSETRCAVANVFIGAFPATQLVKLKLGGTVQKVPVPYVIPMTAESEFVQCPH